MDTPEHIQVFKKQLERGRIEAQDRLQTSRPTLAEQIAKWWDDLPAEEKFMTYSMEFFVSRFGAPPSKIGPTLYCSGWRRRRRWETGRPHCRVWFKLREKEDA